MALFRRKKQSLPDTAEEQAAHPEPPVTLVLASEEGGGPDGFAALFSALPEYSEIACTGSVPETPEDKHFCVCGDSGTYRGRYVVRVYGREWSESGCAEELFGFLLHAEEDLVFFGNTEKGSARGGDPLAAVLRGERPLPAHCAVRRELAENTSGLRSAYAETFAPLLFAKGAASLSLSLGEKVRRPAAAADDVLALTAYFGKVKSALDAERYRFAFNYLCRETIAYFARAAAEGETEALANFDERLKKENMAVWVAAAEKAPAGFVRLLRRHGYRPPFYLKAALRAFGFLKS